MSFAEAVTRQQDAVFRSLGEDAAWTGIAASVRVRCRSRDAIEPFGASHDVVQVAFIHVRPSEVPAPAHGDQAVLARGTFTVIAQPLQNSKGVWVCQVAPAA